MNNLVLRAATESELPEIWSILRQAIEQRRRDGSAQWQNGYPNEQTARDDIRNGNAYVLVDDAVLVAYAAVIFGVEPAYADIDGQWLAQGPYAVVHRVARSDAARGKGVATRLFQQVEALCLARGVCSIRLDTNFDNAPMLHIAAKLGYVYCGEIFFQGASRRAYEKVLVKPAPPPRRPGSDKNPCCCRPYHANSIRTATPHRVLSGAGAAK